MNETYCKWADRLACVMCAVYTVTGFGMGVVLGFYLVRGF